MNKPRLTHAEKLKRIQSLGEDEFRDRVVRELFLLEGFYGYKDTCGTDEEGKDCILFKDAEFDNCDMYAIQTKCGKITMAANPEKNLLTIVSQLQMALHTSYPDLKHGVRRRPNVVYLVCDSQISKNAMVHICDHLNDPRLKILDGDAIVRWLDKKYQTFWLNIDHAHSTYLEGFGRHMLAQSDVVTIHPASGDNTMAPINDEAYVEQLLIRASTKVRIIRGRKAETVPVFEEIKDSHLLSKSYGFVFVIGEGGQGKTTMLRRLAFIQAKRSREATEAGECVLPIVLRAKELLGCDAITTDLLTSVGSATAPLAGHLSAESLNSGAVTLFVDSLDEIGTTDGAHKLLNVLWTFQRDHPKCSVICASRPLQLLREFANARTIPVFEIADFSLKQASRIVRRAARGENVENAATEVLRRLQSVHGMKLSPMLVTVFAATQDFESQDIPLNMTSIFRKFAAHVLGQWDQRKGATQQYDYDLKHRLLQNIALLWHSKKLTGVTVVEFKDELNEILTKVGQTARIDILTEEILRSGLFAVDGDTIYFRHLLFQEYFAGCSIESIHDLLPAINDEWWRTVTVFAYGNRPDKGDELQLALREVSRFSKLDQYRALMTLGLALQACYMTNVQERRNIMGQVLISLAEACTALAAGMDRNSKFPVTNLLYTLIEVRQSVASDLLDTMDMPLASEAAADWVRYLFLVGLAESGNIAKVPAQIKGYDPKDQRLLFGLLLSFGFISKIRVSTQEEKTIAAQLVQDLSPHLRPMIQEVFKEYQTMILEIQQGNVIGLEAPILTPQGQYEMDFGQRT